MSNHITIDLFQASKQSLNLELLQKNIKKEVIGVIFFSPSFLTRNYKRWTYNMLALMLDPRFKSLKLIFFLIGWTWGSHSWKIW